MNFTIHLYVAPMPLLNANLRKDVMRFHGHSCLFKCHYLHSASGASSNLKGNHGQACQHLPLPKSLSHTYSHTLWVLLEFCAHDGVSGMLMGMRWQRMADRSRVSLLTGVPYCPAGVPLDFAYKTWLKDQNDNQSALKYGAILGKSYRTPAPLIYPWSQPSSNVQFGGLGQGKKESIRQQKSLSGLESGLKQQDWALHRGGREAYKYLEAQLVLNYSVFSWVLNIIDSIERGPNYYFS